MNRRTWIGMGASLLAAGRRAIEQQARPPANTAPRDSVLPIERYQPKSVLHVTETQVSRARFAVIDFHTHITGAAPGGAADAIHFSMDAANCLAVMDRRNIRTMVNLTGGYGEGLREAIPKLQTTHSGRFLVFTEPAWSRASDADYAKFQADRIEDAHRAGAKGLKVLKTLGLFVRESGNGELVRIDDVRFDPMWEVVGALRMLVAIHGSDPEV